MGLKFLALLLWLGSAPVWGACTQIYTQLNGKPVVHCASTGDPVQDGTDLWNYLNGASFTCGTRIILDAGKEYNTYETGGFRYGFRLKRLPNCIGTYTEIVSSALHLVPEQPQVADTIYMPKLVVASLQPTGSSSAVFDLFGSGGLGTEWWALKGLALKTGLGLTGNPGTFVVAGVSFGATTSFNSLPKHILIDRCAFYPGEEEAYGPMQGSTIQDNFFRAPNIAFSAYGEDIWIKNSSVIGFVGMQPGSPVSTTITAGTNANPPVLTATGIAAAFGLASGISACDSGCTGTCWTSFGCRVAVFDGAEDGWTPLNGWHYVVYDSADTVRVYNKQNLPVIDSTSWGAFSGTVNARRGIPNDPIYALAFSDCEDCGSINNYIHGWSMDIFTGGNNFSTTDYWCTVAASGSDTSHLVCEEAIQGLKVGDLIKYTNTGTGNHQGLVTDITGTTITFSPYGETSGLTPTAGTISRWNGHQVEDWQLRRTYIRRDNRDTSVGKGYLELKNCVNCLIDGLVMDDDPNGNWFLTTRNQAGNDPWVRAENVLFSNNMMGGELGANARHTLQGMDDLARSHVSKNVWSRNNLLPGVLFPAGTNYYQIYGGGGCINCGWDHNTFISNHDGQTHRWGIPQDCELANNYLLTDNSLRVQNNILSFGTGTNTAVAGCGWTNQFTEGIRYNLFEDDLGMSPNIPVIYPAANQLVSNIHDEFVGICNYPNFVNCRLDPSSSFRGDAEDGKDPGVDLDEMVDHQRGWSEDAGLIYFTSTGWYFSGQVASTKAIMLVKARGETCTVNLYTNPIRTTEHADTTGGVSCGRAGSINDNGVYQFVAGTASALTASTTYYYKVTVGSKVMVGSFTTTPASALDFTLTKTFSTSRTGNYSSNSDMSSPTGLSGAQWDVPIPAGAVRYVQETGGRITAYLGH